MYHQAISSSIVDRFVRRGCWLRTSGYSHSQVPDMEHRYPAPTVAATQPPTATATLAATDVPTVTAAFLQAIAECTAEATQGEREAYASIADLLFKLWLLDPELCAVVAKQPWILGQEQGDGSNGTLEEKRLVLESIHRLGSADIELANLAVSVPWLVDGLNAWEAQVIHELSNLAEKNANLARDYRRVPLVQRWLFSPNGLHTGAIGVEPASPHVPPTANSPGP